MELDQALAFLSEQEFNILIAEDSESNVALIELYFSKTACRLDVASNGQEAVDLFKDNDYALILMDIQMPVMDGYEATRLIRELESQTMATPTPIIAVTANIHDEERDRCAAIGCTSFLPKPISKASLLCCIADHLSSQ